MIGILIAIVILAIAFGSLGRDEPAHRRRP